MELSDNYVIILDYSIGVIGHSKDVVDGFKSIENIQFKENMQLIGDKKKNGVLNIDILPCDYNARKIDFYKQCSEIISI